MTAKAISTPNPYRNRFFVTTLAVVGVVAFSVLVSVSSTVWYRFLNAHFPNVGTSTWLALVWGWASRLNFIVFALPIVIWRPALFGFQVGQINRHWRMLLIMLLVNCGVIGGYLWLTSSGTPFSGNQWLLTETVTVPLVEETVFRGILFTGLLALLGRVYPGSTSHTLAVWLSGISFGLLHINNFFTGEPLMFVAVQMLSAVIWGVMYGYARSRTGSIYPPMLLHAAMNLVVVLF